MKPMHLIGATMLAAAVMMGYVHSFVYTRVEGEKLERQIESLDRELERRLERIEDKLDKILVKRRGNS